MDDQIGTTAKERETRGNVHDDEYRMFLRQLQVHFALVVKDKPLFTTAVDGKDLWRLYLTSFQPNERQFHDCAACRHFVEKYGTLVVINPITGGVVSPLWTFLAPAPYDHAFERCKIAVENKVVQGVFYDDAVEFLGTSCTGNWRHFSIPTNPNWKPRSMMLDASQSMTEKLQDFITVSNALDLYPLKLLKVATDVLESDQLFRSVKVLGQAHWLYKLKKDYEANCQVDANAASNLVWLAVATTPAGFCHPRSSMIGTLLEDLANGVRFDEVKRRFAEKMDPGRYQRPQAAPRAGNVAAAEKTFERLGLARSLERRYADVREVEAIWTSRAHVNRSDSTTGIFSGVEARREPHVSSMTLHTSEKENITWHKFSKKILPSALEIDLLVPAVRTTFGAITTAVDLSAPPIIKWDFVGRRNPFSWYLYNNGSYASKWNLQSGQFTRVLAVTKLPCFWRGCEPPSFAEGVFLLLDGARDERRDQGNGLFPEVLKSDLHEFRSTIEAYSKNAKLEWPREPMAATPACGLVLPSHPIVVRVRTGSMTTTYTIDRWE